MSSDIRSVPAGPDLKRINSESRKEAKVSCLKAFTNATTATTAGEK